eukprot:1765981-Rhodomonas_salina.3
MLSAGTELDKRVVLLACASLDWHIVMGNVATISAYTMSNADLASAAINEQKLKQVSEEKGKQCMLLCYAAMRSLCNVRRSGIDRAYVAIFEQRHSVCCYRSMRPFFAMSGIDTSSAATRRQS